MSFACQHFADDQSLQSAFNGLHLFHASRFQILLQHVLITHGEFFQQFCVLEILREIQAVL